MAKYVSAQDVAYYAYHAGFRGGALVIAVAVSYAENTKHQVDIINHNSNGSEDYGLWQIDSIHPQFDRSRLLSDPQYNADAAYAISSQGKNFHPWTQYRNGAYLKYKKQSTDTTSVAPYMHHAGPPDKNFIEKAVGGAVGAVHSVTGWGAALGTVLAHLSSGAFWLRIGQGAAAIVVLLLALGLIFRKDIGTVAKGVA